MRGTCGWNAGTVPTEYLCRRCRKYCHGNGYRGNHVTPDTTQQPDDTKQPGDTQQPDDTQQPGDIQQPDDIQQPEELPQPSAVEGLHTTKQGKTKVYLEWEESSDATSYVIYRKTAGGEYKNLPRGASHPIPIKTYHPVRHIHIKLLQKRAEGSG